MYHEKNLFIIRALECQQQQKQKSETKSAKQKHIVDKRKTQNVKSIKQRRAIESKIDSDKFLIELV